MRATLNSTVHCGESDLESRIERFRLDTLRVADVVPPPRPARPLTNSVRTPYEYIRFPRARRARFRPSWARFGRGFGPGPEEGQIESSMPNRTLCYVSAKETEGRPGACAVPEGRDLDQTL